MRAQSGADLRIGEEANTGNQADFEVEPAVEEQDVRDEGAAMIKKTYENLALSTSARAARLFSSSV